MSKKKLTEKHNKSRKLTINLEFLKFQKLIIITINYLLKKKKKKKETEGTLLTLKFKENGCGTCVLVPSLFPQSQFSKYTHFLLPVASLLMLLILNLHY